ATEKEREHREKFMMLRPACRPQSGISVLCFLWPGWQFLPVSLDSGGIIVSQIGEGPLVNHRRTCR
ncbi:MAG: hypothetical protein WCI17_12575, partial [bacterium]